MKLCHPLTSDVLFSFVSSGATCLGEVLAIVVRTLDELILRADPRLFILPSYESSLDSESLILDVNHTMQDYNLKNEYLIAAQIAQWASSHRCPEKHPQKGVNFLHSDHR
jgi:hypothetical protein